MTHIHLAVTVCRKALGTRETLEISRECGYPLISPSLEYPARPFAHTILPQRQTDIYIYDFVNKTMELTGVRAISLGCGMG